ncbi:MAG: hypothetical protein ACXWCB_05400 [Acidimicrobiales bacterium]
MKRLLALLVAAVMITGAFWVRDRIGSGSSSGGGSSDTNASGAVLVCATELAPTCNALHAEHPDVTVRIEDVQLTLERLSGAAFDPAHADDAADPSAAIDAWLVPQPWPQMVAEQRQRAGLGSVALGDASPTLARSPLVIAIWNDRRDVLATRCDGGVIEWKCIGTVAGTPWGTTGPQATWGSVKPGQPAPDTTAAGLLGLGEATASWFGSADFASNDFSDGAFRTWFTRLEQSVPSFPASPRTPLDDMLFTGPASFDLTASTEAAAGPAIASSRDSGRLTILYPSPLTTADVVLAPVSGSPAGGRLMKLMQSDDAAAALAAAGWRVDGQPLADGIPADPQVPAESNVPKAGVLQALRSLWIGVVR